MTLICFSWSVTTSWTAGSAWDYHQDAGGRERDQEPKMHRVRDHRPRSQSPEPQTKSKSPSVMMMMISHHRMRDNGNGPISRDRVHPYAQAPQAPTDTSATNAHQYHQYNQWLSKKRSLYLMKILAAPEDDTGPDREHLYMYLFFR